MVCPEGVDTGSSGGTFWALREADFLGSLERVLTPASIAQRIERQPID